MIVLLLLIVKQHCHSNTWYASTQGDHCIFILMPMNFSQSVQEVNGYGTNNFQVSLQLRYLWHIIYWLLSKHKFGYQLLPITRASVCHCCLFTPKSWQCLHKAWPLDQVLLHLLIAYCFSRPSHIIQFIQIFAVEPLFAFCCRYGRHWKQLRRCWWTWSRLKTMTSHGILLKNLLHPALHMKQPNTGLIG